MTGILDNIKKIRVVAFDRASLSVDGSTGKPTVNRDVPPRRMNDGTVIRQQIGSIAQDWVADFPQLVVEPQTDDQYYGLNYERIGVVALGGVKKLTTLVERETPRSRHPACVWPRSSRRCGSSRSRASQCHNAPLQIC